MIDVFILDQCSVRCQQSVELFSDRTTVVSGMGAVPVFDNVHAMQGH